MQNKKEHVFNSALSTGEEHTKYKQFDKKQNEMEIRIAVRLYCLLLHLALIHTEHLGQLVQHTIVKSSNDN